MASKLTTAIFDLRDLMEIQIIFDESAHSAAHRRRAATVQKCGSIF